MDSNEIARIAQQAGQAAADLVRFTEVLKRLRRSAEQDEPVRLSGRDSKVLIDFIQVLRNGE